jgi:hypothetical protein
MKYTSLLGFLLAIILFSQQSCLKAPPLTTQFYADIMAIHASCDAPAVDLLVGDKVTNTSLTYGTNTTYQKVLEGTHNFKLNVAGTAVTAINVNPTLVREKKYTLFAINNIANLTEGYMVDDNVTNPAIGKCHIRFINLSGDAPKLDLGFEGGASLFQQVVFKEVTDYTPISYLGPTKLNIRIAGTSTELLDIPTQYFVEGKSYTVFVSGYYIGLNKPVLRYTLVENK